MAGTPGLPGRRRPVIDHSSCDDRGGFTPEAEAGVVATPGQSRLEHTRHRSHPRCVLCGAEHDRGLRLDFELLPDGRVRAVFAGGEAYEGYPDTLHGGIIAALLDSAMTNCLFARGVIAVTARLNVRYLRPARLGSPVEVVGTLDKSSRSLHYLSAEVRQDGTVVANASGTFKDRTPASGSAAAPAGINSTGAST
jgi:uncharacterized protein (TIGR00369 family)